MNNARHRRECLFLLGQITYRLEPGDPSLLDLAIDRLSNLDEMLRRTRAAPGDRQDILRLYREIIATPVGQPLSDLAPLLADGELDDRLFICLLGDSCQMQDAIGLYEPVYMNFELVESREELRVGRPPRGRVRGIERRLSSLILRVPTEYPHHRAVGFLGATVHEYRHFHDHFLLSDWVRANRTLIAHRQPPDELFSQNVSFTDPGTAEEVILMFSGFFYAFVESRGYATQSQLFRRYLDDELFATIDAQGRRNGIGDITDRGGAEILRAARITEANLYSLGETYERQMRDTIRRAARYNRN